MGTAQNRGEQDEGDGGNIIGAILAGHDGRRSRIYHTAVHPEARGMGVGSLLAGHAVEALRALGLPKVAVGVYADNKAGNDCVCSIESGPCERVESLQMSGRF
ncbi:GNAT family N-acetyltransferase [Bifidobacterium breve]|uniref:GNAT family N-acetyltransferase n=1 Tax=Bifidobacterium breve TaxID=1685 RepID=UPI00321BB26C